MFDVKQWAARLIKWGKTAGTTATKGRIFHQTNAEPIDAEQGDKALAGTARQLQHFGFRSVPVAGSEIVLLATRGFVQQSVAVASDNPSYGPAALAEGEVEIYNKVSGTKMLLDKDGRLTALAGGSTLIMDPDGKVTVTAKAGATLVMDQNGKLAVDSVAPQDVVVNGGTLQVARKTDHVGGGFFTAQSVAGVGVPPPLTTTLTYTDADGASTVLLSFTFLSGLLTAAVPPAGLPVVTQVKEKITEGALRFKA